MSLAILGMGTASPPRSSAQPDAAKLAKAFCCRTEGHERLLPMLYQRTRIRRRGSVLLEAAEGPLPSQSFFPPIAGTDDHGPTTSQRMDRYAQEAPRLAVAAARHALKESGLAAGRITHLITVSCTGFMAPGIEHQLIKALELSREVSRLHVGFMGCHGALNGLQAASAFLKTDPAACVFLCAVELCSLHFRYGWDAERVVSNALFADGAAAIIAAPNTGVGPSDWWMTATGSFVFPDSESAMTWRIGDHGFEMTISPRTPELIAASLRSWLEPWLSRHRCSLERIGSWAVHPGGARILHAVADGLGLPRAAMAASEAILAECGNMSSPTVLFVIDRLRRAGAAHPCIALGFGPGLVAEAALFL